MTDVIKQVVSIQGQQILFFGIVYLEDGIHPKAMLLAKPSTGAMVLACRSHSNINTLTELLHGIGGQVSLLYDCPLDVSPIQNLVEDRGYAELLVQMKQEWRRQKEMEHAIISYN